MELKCLMVISSGGSRGGGGVWGLEHTHAPLSEKFGIKR